MSERNQKLFLAVEAPGRVGYIDCFLHTPVCFRIENRGEETVRVKLIAESADGLIMRYETQATVPFENAVKITAADLFSPLFLAQGGEPRPARITARLFLGGKEVCGCTAQLTALPYGVWEGLRGNAARLAAFVRPQEACARFFAEALRRAKTEYGASEGYSAAGKEEIRRVLGALFSALRARSPVPAPAAGYEEPVFADGAAFLKAGRPANPLEAGVFVCSCLEGAGLHPVLAVGERRVAVGVWLYDASLLTGTTDDGEVVQKYLSDLAFFETEDVFADRNLAFGASERKFVRALKAGEYRAFTDVYRCRAEGIVFPAQERGAPRAAERTGPVFQGRAWERRLLDFSARNPLLRFSAKNALRIACPDADALFALLNAGAGMRVEAGAENAAPGDEVIALEWERGVLRACADEEETSEKAGRLLRLDREAEEESGAKVLYLAFGLMRYTAGGKSAAAPVALLPAALTRGADGAYLLRAEGACSLNSTLFEFLGLKTEEGDPLGEEAFATPSGAYRAARAAARERGWEVTEEVYLGVFSFRNYFLWHDLRHNFSEFCKNETVRALLRGYAEARSAPEAPRGPLALPLEADGSQEEAVAFAETGASFVLHGPPGTGKSQTIANLIARALGRGKRVLFIAEKRAALDVVMRRLERIGLGDFCLEIAERANKTEIACKIEQTLRLSEESAEDGGAAERAFCTLLGEMRRTRRALHERGQAGFSVSEAIARSLACEEREIPCGSDAFYGSLTEEGFASCRHALAEAERAARACANLRGAPFENVELGAYSEAVRDRVVCASEALLSACRQLKESLALFLGFFRQRAPLLTKERLGALGALAERLASGEDGAYFGKVTAEEFVAFYRANVALDGLLREYFKRFRTLIEPADGEALARFGKEGGDWRLNGALRETAKRLSRAAAVPLPEEDIPKYLNLLSQTLAALRAVGEAPLSAQFCDKNGKPRLPRREEFLRGLRSLEAQCAAAFGAFEAEPFFAACVRAQSGAGRPILENICGAVRSFSAAFSCFLEFTGGLCEALAGEDLPAYAARKAAALLENVDLLRGLCRYRETARRLEREGVGKIGEALERSEYREGGLVAAFGKGVYRRFIEARVAADPALSEETAETPERRAEALAAAETARMEQTRRALRNALQRALPKEGEYPAERAALLRQTRGNARGGLRHLLAEVGPLAARACPCLLMSPSAAAQLLPPRANAYDVVIFDEASQMSTAEAVGCIARARSAIVVGDNNQLPPTRFFCAAAPEEEEEDGESVLDDFLALGFPERRLTWHYRSRHESLIAFSNAMYYHNALRTVPPPDAAKSRVKLVRVQGVYERGGSKRNRAEAAALTEEIVRRLSDPVQAEKSMGVVTFSVAQKEEIERLLARTLAARGLEQAAYAREEPLFVKNLENVQGDERDVILFSVCYGADADGKLSLNFGPLNRAGGWRRLNVAASRAREEMLVFSSVTAAAIGAERTSSRGVLGLRAFLEFAETGRTLCPREDLSEREGIAAHLARELSRLGYPCRRGVGASAFKVDVAVLDPRERSRYLLAILTDGADDVKEEALLKKRLLERAGWRVLLVSSVSYYSNPRRTLARIKCALEEETGQKAARAARYARPYRALAAGARETAAFVEEKGNEEEIRARLAAIVAREEPISRSFLKKRCLETFGVTARGSRLSARLDRIIDGCAFSKDRVYGVDYFYRNPRALAFSRYRTEGKTPLRREAEDFTVYEVVSMVKGALEEDETLYEDDLSALFERRVGAPRADGELAAFLLRCVRYGEEKGIFKRTASDRLTLA